jgi:hypothetical protein
MNKKRRAGATEVFSVSVAKKTKATMKRLAADRHGGNVSALITELVEAQERLEAGRRFLAWVGHEGLTAEKRAELDTELASKPNKRGRAA